MLNGPVQIALFCLLVRYRTFCFAYWSGTERFVLFICPDTTRCFAYWSGTERFVLLNGPVPKFETASSQAGNHRLPLQGTPGSQRLKLLLPNFETTRYHDKELPVSRDWNSWLRALEP